MRGKPCRFAPRLPLRRSIPACAGEAPRKCRTTGTSAVYPRVCGGSPAAHWRLTIPPGLSPRVRGKPSLRGVQDGDEGSIPACAGEAARLQARPLSAPVYPRVCGGSHNGLMMGIICWGLSPRVRGKPGSGGQEGGIMRSIPACAGEAKQITHSKPVKPVYPRVCGGSPLRLRWPLAIRGLSPRVRGKPHQGAEWPARPGSIPACAGEAVSPFARVSRQPVYPRVCGGSVVVVVAWVWVGGLSPRVRGKRFR